MQLGQREGGADNSADKKSNQKMIIREVQEMFESPAVVKGEEVEEVTHSVKAM